MNDISLDKSINGAEELYGDDLIASLTVFIDSVEKQISRLRIQRDGAVLLLDSLNGNIVSRKKASRFVRSKILDVICNLTNTVKRPVTLDEVLKALREYDITISRSYLGAVFSSELKSKKSRIIRVGRGEYSTASALNSERGELQNEAP